MVVFVIRLDLVFSSFFAIRLDLVASGSFCDSAGFGGF